MYLFTLGILAVISLIETFNREIIDKYKMYFVLFVYFLLVFHDGFRWQTGCDWDVYHNYFVNFFKELEIRDAKSSFEPLYNLFVMSVRIFTDNYSVYLITHAVVFYLMVFWGIFKLSPVPFTSLMLLYMVIVPFMGTNRQFLFIGVYFIALYFLKEKQWWWFVLLVFAGYFIHHSAPICLLALLCLKRINKKYLLAALAIAIVISYSGIINKLSPLALILIQNEQINYKLDFYNNISVYNVSLIVSLISLMRKLFWFAILFFMDQKIKNKDNFYYLSYNLYFIGILFYILVNGTVWQQFVSRGMLYFSMMEIFIIPYVLALIKPNIGKLCVMLLLPIYCWLNIAKGFSNYGSDTDFFQPYKGLFINTDYVRQNTD